MGEPTGASARYPYLRGEILRRCSNRDAAERAFESVALHPAEGRILDFGRRSVVEALRAYPDKDEHVRSQMPEMEKSLWTREIDDTVSTAFSFLSPVVEWSFEPERGRVVLRVEDYPMDASTGEYDYGRVRKRRVALSLSGPAGPELRPEILEEEIYEIAAVPGGPPVGDDGSRLGGAEGSGSGA